jgi:hypothetical protein
LVVNVSEMKLGHGGERNNYDSGDSRLSGRVRACCFRRASIRACPYAHRSSRDVSRGRSWIRGDETAPSWRGIANAPMRLFCGPTVRDGSRISSSPPGCTCAAPPASRPG